MDRKRRAAGQKLLVAAQEFWDACRAEGVRRRYQCFNNHRFTTLEKVVVLRPERKPK